jgi:putative nucleotidyltransferase with HDIG domain
VTRDRSGILLAFAGALAVVPAALLHFLGGEQVEVPSGLHLWAVGGSALAAAVASATLSVIGWRRGDSMSVLVGTAFSVMAALLVVHGLTTPGIFAERNGVVAFSGAATLPVGGAILALAAVPGFRGRRGVCRLMALQGVLLFAVLVLGALGLLVPSIVPAVPEAGGTAAFVLLAIGLAFYGLLGLRALRTYLLARRRGDLLVLSGLAWLAAALVGALVLDFRDLGWWLGHVFELVGIAIVGAPVAADLLRRAPSRPLVGDLRGADLVREAEEFLGADVHRLLDRLAQKDAYTEGHTRRVALLAVQVGDELGLPATRLRDLAIGGLLHDIGKLGVPDQVLKKPAPLDEDEFALIRLHPERGAALVAELGFSERVRRLVLDHHERLDGSGYPRGLGRTMGFEARILAVCDVYDALISARVYRGAWEPDAALALIHAGAGALFDRRCVAALERVLGRESVVGGVAAAAAR